MTALTAGFQQLKEYQLSFVNKHPKPSLYQKFTLIVCTEWEEQEIPGIYQYELESNTVDLLYQYPANFKPRFHGQFIDLHNDILYLFGGEDKVFATFNLKTKQMKISKNDALSRAFYPLTTYIPSLNQFHIIDADYLDHVKYSINECNTVEKVATNIPLQAINNPLSNSKLVYVPLKKQLFIFGANRNDQIFYSDINEIDWKLSNKFKMPRAEQLYFDILLMNNLLFVFYFEHKDIHILDLLNEKWHQSEYKVPDCFIHGVIGINEPFVFKDANNFIHIIDFFDGAHCKANLWTIIPMDLSKSYYSHYELLINGFIRRDEKSELIPTIPVVLKKLILRYFPCFL